MWSCCKVTCSYGGSERGVCGEDEEHNVMKIRVNNILLNFLTINSLI